MIDRPRRVRAQPGLVLAGLFCLTPALPAAAQEPGSLTVDQFIEMPVLSDPRPSPDGSLVAYVVSRSSIADDQISSRIFLVGGSGEEVRTATPGGGSERAPRWSADGRYLAFISNRGGSAQIWRMSVDSGTARKVTDFEWDINDLLWSPNGSELYFTADIPWPPADSGIAASPDSRTWTDLFYRHWNGWRTGIRQHLFSVDIVTGNITDLTPIDRDVPTLAIGGRDVGISRPGTELAVVINPDRQPATGTNNDVFVMGPEGSGRQSITTSAANDHSPTYSPNSRWIAWLAMSIPGFESDRRQIMLYERATGRRVSLTPDWDLSPETIAWTPDSRALLAEVEERGEKVIYRIEAPAGDRRRIVNGGVNSSLRVADRADMAVFLRQSATNPPEVYASNLEGGDLRRLARAGESDLEDLDLPPLEPFSFVGALNDTIHGWILKPPDFNPDQRYPLVYLIHGGPQGAWLDQWHQRWNYQMFAARGWVVAAVNFHGSTGYGQTFTNTVSRHWGDYPYEDLMKGLDSLASLPWIDSTRMAAAGASYGGYMVFWMAGQTRRFRTMVAHDGIFNLRSFAGTTDELWFPTWEFGGSLLSRGAQATMEKWSPANFVDRWTTPMLIIHGQQDFRVDISESLQAFTALRERGLPGRFLYFPEAGHFVTSPRDRQTWWNAVLG
ncbi:MAG: prolyl oligopeptidase family serine peptidase, partial [Gemmatimonadales bacterium]